jgi:hypothetical protein
VDSIYALLDDLTREPHTPDLEFVDVRLQTPPAAEFDPKTAAAYRRLDQAVCDVADASRSVTTARIDALIAASRDNLDHAISCAREAFRLLAKPEHAGDPALQHAVREFKAAIDEFSHDLDNLGYARTSGERDIRVAVEDSQRWVRIDREIPDHRALSEYRREDRGEDPGLSER